MIFPGIRKIAVLRANAIGDFIFALPALESLRAAYADAEIVLLGQPWHKRFLEGRPGPIDRVVVIPRKKGVREDRETAGKEDPPERLEQFYGEMRTERFDLALQMHGGGRNSNPFLLQIGARITAGSATPDAPRLDRTLPYIYWQHEIARLLEVVGLVGARPVTLEPRLALTQADMVESYRCHAPRRGGHLAAVAAGEVCGRRRRAGAVRRSGPADRRGLRGAHHASGGCANGLPCRGPERKALHRRSGRAPVALPRRRLERFRPAAHCGSGWRAHGWHLLGGQRAECGHAVPRALPPASLLAHGMSRVRAQHDL